jgi:hypothetical protein
MEEFILVAYDESKDKFSIVGHGSLDDILKVKRTIDSLLNCKLKEVALPKTHTLQELLSDNELLRQEFGYIKDLSADVVEQDVEQQVNFDDIDIDNEYF